MSALSRVSSLGKKGGETQRSGDRRVNSRQLFSQLRKKRLPGTLQCSLPCAHTLGHPLFTCSAVSGERPACSPHRPGNADQG